MKFIRILTASILLTIIGTMCLANPEKISIYIANKRTFPIYVATGPTLEQAINAPFKEIEKTSIDNSSIYFDSDVHMLISLKSEPKDEDELYHYTFEAGKNIAFEVRRTKKVMNNVYRQGYLKRLLQHGFLNHSNKDYSIVLKKKFENSATTADISSKIIIYSPDSTGEIERKPGFTLAPTGPGWDTDSPDLPQRKEDITHDEKAPDLPERTTNKKEAPTDNIPSVPTDPSLQPPMPADITPAPPTNEDPEEQEETTSDIPEPPTQDDVPTPPTDGPPTPEFAPPMPDKIDTDSSTKPVLPFDPLQLLKGKEGLKKVEEDSEKEKTKKEAGGLEGALQKRFEDLDTGDDEEDEDTPESDDEDTDDSEWENDEDFDDEAPEPSPGDKEEPEDEDETTTPPIPTDSEPPMPKESDGTTRPDLPFSTADLLKQKEKIESDEENSTPKPLPRDEEKTEEENNVDLIRKTLEERRKALELDDAEEDDEENTWDDDDYDWED